VIQVGGRSWGSIVGKLLHRRRAWVCASEHHRAVILAILERMSTLDPGLEPPGEWPPPYPTPPTGRTQASERAAGYIWLCAGLSLAMSCCCGIRVGEIFALPTSELMSQVPADMPNRGQIQQLLPVIGIVMGIVGVMLLVIPGTALAFLGFPGDGKETMKAGRPGFHSFFSTPFLPLFYPFSTPFLPFCPLGSFQKPRS